MNDVTRSKHWPMITGLVMTLARCPGYISDRGIGGTEQARRDDMAAQLIRGAIYRANIKRGAKALASAAYQLYLEERKPINLD